MDVESKTISSEWIQKIIKELDQVQVYEDNYTLCQNASYALKCLLSPYVGVTKEEEDYPWQSQVN